MMIDRWIDRHIDRQLDRRTGKLHENKWAEGGKTIWPGVFLIVVSLSSCTYQENGRSDEDMSRGMDCLDVRE